jgi:hypothetical protein
LANLAEDGQAGKATESPAFTDDLNCDEAGTAAGPARSTGRPDVAPGKPATSGNANDGAKAAEDKAERTEKAGKSEDASDAQAGRDVGGTADRGRSGEHRQDG